MKTQGDTKRPRSVKAEFDPDFCATSHGGAVLAEKALRGLGLRRTVERQLPTRAALAKFSMADAVHALCAGLLVGGRGIGATEALRDDALLTELFGLGRGAPSDSTVYRVLCELSGLHERKVEDCYVAAGSGLAALDMFGAERREPKRRRVVPEAPEAAGESERQALDRFTSSVAVSCIGALARGMVRLHGWHVGFGDATDLEVEGNCFDAARMGREGTKLLRWQTLMLGPILIAEQLHEGNVDEGRSMPRLLAQARETIRRALGPLARVLLLLDGAYFEKQVLDALVWDFIVCANQQRDCLRRLAEERAAWEWQETGADAGRGWSRSEVSCFTHLPDGWERPVTIVARRWQKADEIAGAWHYAFLATRIEPEALPKKLVRKHGYCSAIWMLYGTKQGREDHYKTPLRDLGLHHPPSCRLGVNQAFYALATAASNIAMVLRYRVVAKPERGISLWRLRQRYFQIPAYLVQTARRLTVRLAGANVAARRQVLWRAAFAAASRL